MDEKINSFLSLLESEEAKESLGAGEKLKKIDKSNDKRLLGVILLSIVSMTVLGFFALGLTGSIIFFAIAVISSFWLFYSSKKNMLLKYLSFYRTRVPKVIAMAEGVEVKAENIPECDIISSINEGKPAYRMCHRYGDLYVGFLKFIKNGESVLQGIIYFTEGDDTSLFEERLKEQISDFVIKSEDGKVLLFMPGFDDYLGGRIEHKDDLTADSLLRQYKYYLLGDAFKKAVNGKDFQIPEL